MRTHLTVFCAAAAMLLAGCSGSPGASPAPTTTTAGSRAPSSAASSSVPPGVPKVTDPINMAEYIKHPCRALTEAQLKKLSVPTEPQPDPDAPAGPSCDWDAFDESGFTVLGGAITAGSSLAGSYAKNRRGGFENFKPFTVAGYPGYLHWDDDISCTAAVAVRNDLLYVMVVTVDQDSPRRGQQCEIAKKAAKLATKTISGRS